MSGFYKFLLLLKRANWPAQVEIRSLYCT